MLYEHYFIDDLKDRTALVRLTYAVRILAIAILFSAFNVLAFGQEPPKSVLFDEFGNITCEDLLARNDAFLIELANNPQDIGYVILYSNARNPKGFVRFLEASLFMRRFDRSRIEIGLSSSGGDGDVQGAFWRVPPGATPPVFDKIEIPGPDTSKPFIAGTNFTDNVCPSFSADKYAKLILDTPGSRGRLVIFGPSSLWRRTAAEEELEMFRRHTQLPRNRIELYFVHTSEHSYATTEYWYIPAKKR